jgi:putative salt-induced outer membrane protein
VSALAQAQPAAPPPPPPRQEGTAEFAFVGTSGNASTQTIGLGGEYIYRPEQWVITNKTAFVRNKSESTLTAETFSYLFRAARTISPRLSGLGQYDYFRDEFAGVLHRHSLLGGLQYKLVDLPMHALIVDGGLGYVKEHRSVGANVSSAAWSAGAGYRWKLSPTAEFSDDVRLVGLFSTPGGWRLQQAAAITARVTKTFSLKVANTIRYVSDPVPGFKNTDTSTSVALVAKF